MYDLRMIVPDGRTAAVEVTAAGDPDAIEQWNLMNSGDRWIVETIRGGWMVEVRIGSSWNRLRTALPALLAELETLSVSALRVADPACHHLEQLAEDLGIASARQSATAFPGSVYMTFDIPSDRAGGAVADNGDALATWVGSFLRERKQADLLRKLAASDADESHAFIILPGFNTAPFVVNDLLLRSGAPVPTMRPDLPEPVTHVWAVSTWTSGVGFRWAPLVGWLTFDKGVDENGTVTL